jgi:RNA-directed DNA polymerase
MPMPCVYVRSERAGQRVMASIATFIEQRLKLRVNRHKSAVAPATTRPFLGFGFYRRDGRVKIGVSPKARQRAKDRLRQLTARNWGVSMERRIHAINRYTVGCAAYFALADGERLSAILRRAGFRGHRDCWFLYLDDGGGCRELRSV